MKRNAVSLLLAICFVLFLIPSAAAAQTVQLQLNKPVTVDDIASFTPAKTDDYTFSAPDDYFPMNLFVHIYAYSTENGGTAEALRARRLQLEYDQRSEEISTLEKNIAEAEKNYAQYLAQIPEDPSLAAKQLEEARDYVRRGKLYLVELRRVLDEAKAAADGDVLPQGIGGTFENGALTVHLEQGKTYLITVEVSMVVIVKLAAGTFRDVPKDSYYTRAVEWAVEHDVTNGTGDGFFSPDETCTRAQVVTFLWRRMGMPEAAKTARFSDVSADQYYAKAVSWAVSRGITEGTGGGCFSPDEFCTRAQVVTFLYRLEMGGVEHGDRFVDVFPSDYYYSPVYHALKRGITAGVDDTHFAPNDPCTRAQVVTFLYRSAVT